MKRRLALAVESKRLLVGFTLRNRLEEVNAAVDARQPVEDALPLAAAEPELLDEAPPAPDGPGMDPRPGALDAVAESEPQPEPEVPVMAT